MEELAAAELDVQVLLRRLCRSISTAEVISARADPDIINQLQPQLKDIALSVLLGLHPEAAPRYVPPDGREQQAVAGIAAAAQQLRQSGYAGLAYSLQAATASLQSCGTFRLLGSLTEAETGAAAVLPLTEHASLLGLLLALAGTCPSLRQQRFTFQVEEAAAPATAPHQQPGDDPTLAAVPAAAAAAAATLSTSVFSEAPDPFALTDGSAAVAVLLPQELGLPSEAFAGAEDVQDLCSGLDSRPVWSPAAASSLPPPRAAVWLPVPASLLELQRDGRRGAPPGPLGLPLSLLCMDDEPGSCTLFSPDAAAGWDAASDCGDAASADSVQPHCPAGGGGAGESGAAAPGGTPERHLGLSCQLWSLGEVELAHQALLALQGVGTSLLRLQALLREPGALPRRAITGLLRSLAAAGELRQRLHEFVAAFSCGGGPCSPARGPTGSGGGGGTRCSEEDPVQQAFAAAVAQVLQRQSAALQQLEQQQACSWVQTVAVGGTPGRRFHGRGPSLLQVALHTRRLQLQLRSLADLCWCSLAAGADGSGNAGIASAASGPGLDPQPAQPELGGSWLWQQGFPAGTELLDYLYRRANEADDADSPMLRFLFVQAIQPYLRHMHAWAFTPHVVSREFGMAGDKELLTLDFLPPAERQATALVPADPPAFFAPLHAAFMRAGSQLRLLHSLEHHGRHLAHRLAGIAEQEVLQRQHSGAGPAGAAGAAVQAPGTAHSFTSFSALLPGPAASAGPFDAAAAAGAELLAEPREPWISLACGSASAEADTADGSQDLQLSSSSLRRAVEISQEQDSTRAAAVDAWLGTLALQRRLAEHAAASEQLGRAAAQRERTAERAALQAAALSRQQSSKAALLQEQQAAVAERRARRASEQAQQEAADRQLQAQAARQQHSAALAELEQALGRAGLGGTHPPAAAAGGRETQAGEAQPAAAPAQGHLAQPAGSSEAQQQPAAGDPPAPAHPALPAGLPTLKTRSRQRFADEQQQQQQQENAVPPAAQAQGGAGAAGAAGSRQPLAPGQAGLQAAAPLLPGLPYAASAELQHQMALSSLADLEGGGGGEAEDALAPLPAVLETSITHSVLSQYRAVSRACVRLFLDEFKVLEHLEALRRFFFQGAGDWAEALVQRLGAHADSLLPLASHQADAMLEDAARRTSADGDPYASHLRIKMLPGGTSAIQAQVGAINVGATPQRRARSFWSSQHTGERRAAICTGADAACGWDAARGREPPSVGPSRSHHAALRCAALCGAVCAVTLAPTQLDALDCLALDYQVGWPLSAVLTEDTLQGYAAVFSWMVRLRRAEQLLRAAAPPLAAQPKSSADLLLSEEEADKAHRRVQALRAFRFGAAQFVTALQAFLQSRTTGDAWAHLLAKLMVSSEEVAATLISRQPSALMTGLLSRMNSLGPTGKAAHKLAQQMSRALSASLPGSPTAAAGAGNGQLARFNSLLAAAGAGSAPTSAAGTPRAGAAAEAAAAASARQLSRFAGKPATGTGGPFAAAADQDGSTAQRWDPSATSTPTAAATAGGGGGLPLSAQTSFTSAMLGQAAAEASSAGGVADLDAAAWAHHFQRSQQGIADLQELLDLHRRYVRQASEECLTFGGSLAVREAVEGCLQCLVTFAYKLLGTVRSGAGRRLEETWTQALRLDAAWAPLAASMADFEARAQQLQELLADASSRSVLAELQLDFNGFYARRRQQRQRQQERQEAGQQQGEA